MYEFGSGTVWGCPVAGNLPTNPTPLKLGTLQDVSLDLSFEIKELYGQLQFPVSVARAKGKITGKAKFGRLNSNFFNQFFFGATATQPMEQVSTDGLYVIAGQLNVVALHTASGGTGYVAGDTGTIAGGTAGFLATYQVLTVSAGAVVTFAITYSGAGYATGMSIATTATSGAGSGFLVDITSVAAANTIRVAQASTVLQDLGVIYNATGVPLIKVGSSPALGQYAYASGIYTFNSSESATAVFAISYMYLAVSSTYGYTQAVMNQFMGYSPILTVTFHTIFNNQEFNWILWNCIFNKLSLTTKIDDYLIPEMDFSAFADSGNRVINIYGVE